MALSCGITPRLMARDWTGVGAYTEGFWLRELPWATARSPHRRQVKPGSQAASKR